MAGKANSKKPAVDYGDRLVARNKRARFNYELGEAQEAGLVLTGSEVRALLAERGKIGRWTSPKAKHSSKGCASRR